MKNNGLLIAIIAVLVLVVVKFAFFGGYDERSIARLMNKCFDKKNYSVTIKMKDENNSLANLDCKLQRKKDVYLYEIDYGSSIPGLGSQNIAANIYLDGANDEVVMTMMGYAFVGHVSDLDDEYSIDKMDKSSSIIENLKEKDIELNYLGIEDYDSKKCIHFEITKKDGKPIVDDTYKEEVYVEKSKGSLERVITYDKNGKVQYDADFEFEFNVVKDLEKPSTSGMTVMNFSDLKK